MSLRYENCYGDCSRRLQNITFCIDEIPERSQSFANEQTIEMIKILIGKFYSISIEVRDLFSASSMLLTDVGDEMCW